VLEETRESRLKVTPAFRVAAASARRTTLSLFDTMRSLARAAASATRRLSTSTSAFAEAAAGSAAPSAADAGAESRRAFQEKLKPFLSSTSAPPCFPSDFMKPRPAADPAAGVPEKLTLNFFLPHEQPKKAAAVRESGDD